MLAAGLPQEPEPGVTSLLITVAFCIALRVLTMCHLVLILTMRDKKIVTQIFETVLTTNILQTICQKAF